ncbi:MAG: biotin carboxylase [Allobranchiibius sp.]
MATNKTTAGATDPATPKAASKATTPAAAKLAAPKSVPAQAAATKAAPAKKTTVKKAPAKKAPAKRAATKKTATKKVASAPVPEVTPVVEAAAPEVTAPEDGEISLGTDAAFAPASPAPSKALRNISEIRHALRTNTVPVFFFGATPFNLLGLDRWVRNFSYITYYDGWDGAHPRVFTPLDKPYVEFESGEEINHWLLENAEVRAYIASKTPEGVRPKVAMVFVDEKTEQICEDAGFDLILPPAELRHRLDSKLVTTRLADEAGVPSVPNVIATVDDWDSLQVVTKGAGLGNDLVIQSAYGDSGKTTYFVDGPESFTEHQDGIVGHEVKIMRRIHNYPVAIEAVLTSCGTVVGPIMSELTGHPELTPYRGGWCGNEMYPAVLTDTARAKATDLVRRLGARIGQEGYRGFFEVDVLVDVNDDEVYLGELNPRISGASAITNVTAGAYADVPLFLFHLLDYLDVEIDIDADEINKRWQRISGADEWSHMIVKETAPGVQAITDAPATGQYTLTETGDLVFRRAALDWHQLQNEGEAFFLRVYGAGDYRWKGADLGVIVTKGRVQHEVDGQMLLTDRARTLIDAIRGRYVGVPIDAEVAQVSIAK